MKVPFLDLKAHHEPHREEFSRIIDEVIDRGAFAGGRFVEEFEAEFARYCHCGEAIGVGSGTDALLLALLGLGVGPGDEVITVPMTFIATVEAISFAGAKPVFVDIDEESYTMDPAQLEAAITPRTKAVVPVHLFGRPADMDPIVEIARAHGLHVIEDAAQAHGAAYKGRRAGSLGDAGCFSFYPGKNLGAFGEGGAVTTNDPELAVRIRMLRDHGQSRKHCHDVVGWNGRMDGIQGAVLRVKLGHLDEGNRKRRERAAQYDRLLGGAPGTVIPPGVNGCEHVYHIYGVRVGRRDEVLSELQRQGIGCAIHYPVPVHLQGAYEDLGHRRGDFPVSERCGDEFLSLPMFPELSPEQAEVVAARLCEATGAGAVCSGPA